MILENQNTWRMDKIGAVYHIIVQVIHTVSVSQKTQTYWSSQLYFLTKEFFSHAREKGQYFSVFKV